jgi:hypothetical protein
MQIENVTRQHRVGGRMVLVKRPATRKGVDGFVLVLEGNGERFIAEGESVEVTTGGMSYTRTRSRR